jgi:hypothetical protein
MLFFIRDQNARIPVIYLLTFHGLPPAHSASASYVGLPVAAAARMSMQLVASLAHATSSIVSTPTSTPVLEMAKGIGRIELRQTQYARKQAGITYV